MPSNRAPVWLVLNQSPVFSSEAEDQTVAVDAVFSYTVPEATDPEGDAILYWASLSGGSCLPDWLSFDPETLAFSGYTVADAYPSELSIQVTADDREDRRSVLTGFTLSVELASLRPQGDNWPYFDRLVGARCRRIAWRGPRRKCPS